MLMDLEIGSDDGSLKVSGINKRQFYWPRDQLSALSRLLHTALGWFLLINIALWVCHRETVRWQSISRVTPAHS